MPNSVTDLYRKYLADTGQTDDRSDYEITDELGRWASQNNPALFDKHPDFGEEFSAIRDANAPSLAGEFGQALKSGTQGLASTALGGLSLLAGSDYLRDKALSFDQDAAANAPTIGALEDIAPGRRGLGSLFSRDAARYALSKVGSVAPSIAEAVVTSGAGALAGSALAPGPGTAAGAAEGLMARNLVKSAIRSLLKKGAAESMVERGIIGEASEAALEQAVKRSIPTVTDLVGREAMAIGAKRGLAATNLANSFLLNAGDVYSEGGDRATAMGLGLVSAIPDTILPTYVIGRLFPGVEKAAAKELAKTYVADRAMKVLKAAGLVSTEAATEYFQEGVNVVARNLKEGKDALTFTPEDMKRFREAGIAGAFGGALAAPGEFVTPKTQELPAATPATELGTMAAARTAADRQILTDQLAETARLAAEADMAKQMEAANLLAEQQAAVKQQLSAPPPPAPVDTTEQTALSMVGETPELAAERELQRTALNMAGAKPLDMTDPEQAAEARAVKIGKEMVGNVPLVTPPAESDVQATPAAVGAASPVSVEQDLAEYKSLQGQMSEMVRAGQAGTPDFNALWQQSEDIKNRHGGMPPGEVAGGDDLAQEPAATQAVAGDAAQGTTSPSQEVVNAPSQIPPRAPIQPGETIEAAVQRLAAEGETALAIAARVNSNTETVRKIAMDNGIAIATKSSVKPDIVMTPRSAEQRGTETAAVMQALDELSKKRNRVGYNPDLLTPENLASAKAAGYITGTGNNAKFTDKGRSALMDFQANEKARALREGAEYDALVDSGLSPEEAMARIKSPGLSITRSEVTPPVDQPPAFRQPTAATIQTASRAQEFNRALSNLQQIGGNIRTFSQEMLAQNTQEVIGQRIASLQQEQAAASDPSVKEELGRRIAVLQEQSQQSRTAAGVTYAPHQIALAVEDVGNANANNLVTLLHEAAESLTMRLTPEQQGAVSTAINSAIVTVRQRAADASAQTGVPLATESSPEDLLAETLAQELTAKGIPDAPSLAQSIIRWVKDAYYRTVMAMQAAFGGQPDPETALAWYENQLRREVLGDYSYAFSNVLDRYLPSPMKERVRRFDGRTGTPGGISDFVDPATQQGTQPQVETLNRDALNWNLSFRQPGNPGAELEIPDPEARARIKAAMINGLAEFYDNLRQQIAPDMSASQFFQQIKRVGEESPQTILSSLGNAASARIGGEGMTEAMNREAQVELWSRIRKFGLAARRQITQLQRATQEGTAKLSDIAQRTNRLEGDLRNAAMHEDLLKLSAKDMVTSLARGIARGYTTAYQSGELVEAIREEERLLTSDPIPEEYQTVLQNIYAGGTPIFEYIKAIAALDLPLKDMSVRDIVKQIRDSKGTDLTLGRLSTQKPLMVTLATLAKRNAEQVDQIQLGWLKDNRRFGQIYGELEQIKQATTQGLRDIRQAMGDRAKAAGLAARLKVAYLDKRAKQVALSGQIARAEERLALLEKALPAIDERTEQAAADAGGAQFEWAPEEGSVFRVMTGEGPVNRVLRFNPDGSAVDGDQLRQDIADNLEWLKANSAQEGKPRYNQIKQQTYALRLLDLRGQQQRTWSNGILRSIDRWVRTPIATARTIGGPSMQRIIQMLNRYQFGLRNYLRNMEAPAKEWEHEFIRLRDASGLKDNAEFRTQVYNPAMYFIATNPGLDEGPALRQAAALVRRSLPAPREDFNERFYVFMRKTKQAESGLLDMANQFGAFVADKRLGSELRKAIPRGWLTGMRSLNGGLVDVLTKDMQQAGWKLAYDEENRGGKLVRTNIQPVTFRSLTPETAANDQAMRALIDKLFTPSIIGQWLEPFIRKTGQEPFVHNGEAIPQALVQEAWAETGGDVLRWIDVLGTKIGGGQQFRLSMLRNLDQLFGHEAKMAYEASQSSAPLDPHGPKPHAIMDARVSDLLPAEHVEFSTYEPDSMHGLVARVAYHGAFGRNARNIQGAFREMMNSLQGQMAQWDTLKTLHSTTEARKKEAAARGWDYNALKLAAANFREARNFKGQLEGVLGVSADSGPLGDFHKGMAILHFITGQIVDNPKTAAYDFLSPAMRPLAMRSLGPTVISNTVRNYGDILQTGLGSLFQSFGLHLFKAGRYADTTGNAEGRAFSNLPYGVVLSDIGRGGDSQSGSNKWLIKPTRILRNLQRKGLQVGGGTATDFPRLTMIPGLGVMNSMSQIAAQASGARMAQEFEQLVKDGIAYMNAHPEAANNPAFRFSPKDIFSNRLDHDLLDWWRQKATEYNMGTLEDIVRDAAARASDDPRARLLTQDQALTLSMMNQNELSGNSSVNTTPAWLMGNRFAQMAMPLMRWPLWMMSQVHESAKPRPGENAVKPMLRVIGTLALWNLPLGLAFSLLMDEYDKRLLGKKTNMPNLDKTAALPFIGLPLTLATSDKPLSQLEAMLVRSARAGNIYGLGADIAAQTLAGLDPSTGQRAFSLDQRVLAYSQLANIGQAILNWKASGQADWGSVGRPVLMALGGNGVLHSVDLTNNLLGLDNAQSRLTQRASAANWVRSAAQELDIGIKRSAFSGTPTPLSANTRQMYLAALANDRAEFLDAYRRALAAARSRVTDDPEVKDKEKEAVTRVLASWRARDPMAVLSATPTESQIARMLSIMEPAGQDSVRSAISRYKSFTELIEPTPFEKYMDRQMTAQRRGFDPDSLRRRMSGSMMFSSR